MGTNGVLVVDKPADWTSMDVCAKLRGVFHEKRVGHAGTLDPMATGVLPVFVGRATRAADFVAEGEKEYVAQLRLGVVTTTQDVTGDILETHVLPAGVGEALAAVLPRFTGELEQVPPMYSAIKKEGKKLYELARKGIEVERKPRRITIHALELLSQDGPADFTLRVVCSKGTYIRTLCHDIGQALGCGGTMAALRRTRVGQFDIGQAVTLDELVQAPGPAAFLRGVETCFAQSGVTIQGLALKRALCGNPFPLDAPAGEYKVFDPEGNFLLLGRCDGKECRIIKSFYEVEQP